MHLDLLSIPQSGGKNVKTFCFVLFCFRLHAFIEAAALLRPIVLRYACAPTAIYSYLTTVCVLFFCCFLFIFILICRLFGYFCTIAVLSLYEEYVARFFLS